MSDGPTGEGGEDDVALFDEEPTDDVPASPARCYLAHDLGTGGDKAVLVGPDGRVLARAFEPYPLHHPRPHWAEQDPQDWWDGVVRATRRVLAEAGVPPEAVAGIGFAGQMLALAPLDAQGRPTRPAISWLDARDRKSVV